MSTLLTAVLTHHLGWVSTCLPSGPDDNPSISLKSPFNPLWGELSDLYGAVGHPLKMAHTIVTGTNRKDLISKILITMTYFIRCCDVERKIPMRCNIEEENKTVELICQKYSYIPLENYKKYEDHVREIMGNNNTVVSSDQKKADDDEKDPVKTKKIGLTKTRTCRGALVNLENTTSSSKLGDHVDVSLYPILERDTKSLYPNLEVEEDNELNCWDYKGSFQSCEDLKKNVKPLSRVTSSSVLCHLVNEPILTVREHPTANVDVQRQMNSGDLDILIPPDGAQLEESKDVVFFLGENEELIGLKKGNPQQASSSNETTTQTPVVVDFSQQLFLLDDEKLNFKDSDFIKNEEPVIKPSTSWTSLVEPSDISASKKNVPVAISDPTKFTRSQSVPPEDKKLDGEFKAAKSKYRYSGVKFNIKQYPQILSNYMKSKNLEISNLHFGDKTFKFDDISSLVDCMNSKYPYIGEGYEESEALQTPSNASELEFSSDSFVAPSEDRSHSTDEAPDESRGYKMQVAHLPMPKYVNFFLFYPFRSLIYPQYFLCVLRYTPSLYFK